MEFTLLEFKNMQFPATRAHRVATSEHSRKRNISPAALVCSVAVVVVCVAVSCVVVGIERARRGDAWAWALGRVLRCLICMRQ